MNARATPCPHRPPTRGDNTGLVAQGDTATPGATKQLLPPDRVLGELYVYIYIYIYIYIIACQINQEQRLHWTLIFIFSVQFVIKKTNKQKTRLLSAFNVITHLQ